MYKCPMTGPSHPPLNKMVMSYERIYGDNTQYKRPPQTSEDAQMYIYWCLGSKPCSVLRCTFKFLILVNGLAGPLLHPATLHGKGPTLSALPAQVLKWSSKLFCLVNPSLPQPFAHTFPFSQLLVGLLMGCEGLLGGKQLLTCLLFLAGGEMGLKAPFAGQFPPTSFIGAHMLLFA